MASYTDQPHILRGAFVEYGISIPPLMVVFQFNPEKLTRNRSLSYSSKNNDKADDNTQLRSFHQKSSLKEIQKDQVVKVQEETLSFELRLDATDSSGGTSPLHINNPASLAFGVAPQLATLELMVQPKNESVIAQTFKEGFSCFQQANPPMILFIWGRKRVLPVNITSLNITEILYSPDLTPTRATASVSMTVIESKGIPYRYTKAMTEAMSALNLANYANVSNLVIPG